MHLASNVITYHLAAVFLGYISMYWLLMFFLDPLLILACRTFSSWSDSKSFIQAGCVVLCNTALLMSSTLWPRLLLEQAQWNANDIHCCYYSGHISIY